MPDIHESLLLHLKAYQVIYLLHFSVLHSVQFLHSKKRTCDNYLKKFVDRVLSLVLFNPNLLGAERRLREQWLKCTVVVWMGPQKSLRNLKKKIFLETTLTMMLANYHWWWWTSRDTSKNTFEIEWNYSPMFKSPSFLFWSINKKYHFLQM